MLCYIVRLACLPRVTQYSCGFAEVGDFTDIGDFTIYFGLFWHDLFARFWPLKINYRYAIQSVISYIGTYYHILAQYGIMHA
jgi:hypothetical protein